MAKKKSTVPSSGAPDKTTPQPESRDDPEQQIEQSAKVKKAADAVRRAEAELHKASELYRKVRQDATDRLKAAREKTVGDLIDGTIEVVRKHPGPSAIVAVLIGFFLGRLFRR